MSRAQAAEWRCRGTGAAVPLTAGRVHFIESVCRMLTSPTSWLLRRPLHKSKLAAVPWDLAVADYNLYRISAKSQPWRWMPPKDTFNKYVECLAAA